MATHLSELDNDFFTGHSNVKRFGIEEWNQEAHVSLAALWTRRLSRKDVAIAVECCPAQSP
jgi:hypothetical protein